MKNIVSILIIAACIGTLTSCPLIINPQPNGRWNPADPMYDETTDPDAAPETPVVFINTEYTATEGGDIILVWTWYNTINDSQYR